MHEEDDGNWYGDLKALKQAQHREWKQQNMDVLNQSGIPFTSKNFGEHLMFRERGKPKVDFYPSTGRWKVTGKGITGGHAERFLEWYRQQ
jgi:hypothetical protein